MPNVSLTSSRHRISTVSLNRVAAANFATSAPCFFSVMEKQVSEIVTYQKSAVSFAEISLCLVFLAIAIRILRVAPYKVYVSRRNGLNRNRFRPQKC
jgi:hypothetical protein